MSDYKAAAKRSIEPVTITVTVEATRISEKGTFSGFVIKSVKGPNNKTLKAVSPHKSGGGIWLMVESDEGIKFLTSGEAAKPKTAVKLF